ncbi:ABC transporter substrate-binding protein [Streptomyces sp. NPDC002932]|uniref:ABC transporter substrate-binding protein n=1 Tax=Streptomyces sp. NPDC002932 TaxID=3364672 RepID=UPI0036A6A00C
MLAGLGAGAATVLAGGCARGDSTASIPGTTSLANDNATWDAGYVAAGRELKKLTGYALRPLSNPNPTAYTQVTQISLQTTKATDLIKWQSGYNFKQLARTGSLSDLTQVWEAYERKGWVTKSLRDAMSYRGSVYGVPLHQSYYVLFYNTRLFDKHRLRAPETWDELLHNAEVLKRAGVTPFVATQSGNWPTSGEHRPAGGSGQGARRAGRLTAGPHRGGADQRTAPGRGPFPPVPARRCARARGGARGHRRGGGGVTRRRDGRRAAHRPGERVPPGERRSAVRVDRLGHRQAHRPGTGAAGRHPRAQRLHVRRVRHGGRLQPPVEQDHRERLDAPPRLPHGCPGGPLP